jgi:AcrR family transcriptional regulator
MAGQDGTPRAPRLTARGAVTRVRIIEAASELMYVRGVAATTLDDVMSASGTSKSQFYHHFPDKDALVREVVDLRSTRLLASQQQRLEHLDSLRGLERWRDAMVQNNGLRSGAYGCPLGSLASELADQSDDVRTTLAKSFEEWEALLAAGLERMRAKGVLRPQADPESLAVGLMAALQGGYLLAQAARDVTPMRIAIDMAIVRIRDYAT